MQLNSFNQNCEHAMVQKLMSLAQPQTETLGMCTVQKKTSRLTEMTNHWMWYTWKHKNMFAKFP